MIDWPETRLRLHLWLHHAWPFRVIAWLRSRGVPESEDFDKFGDSEFEPLTPEQYAVLANAEPREHGKVIDSLLPDEALHRSAEFGKTQGQESSEYFFDKCGAESGDFGGDNPNDESGKCISHDESEFQLPSKFDDKELESGRRSAALEGSPPAVETVPRRQATAGRDSDRGTGMKVAELITLLQKQNPDARVVLRRDVRYDAEMKIRAHGPYLSVVQSVRLQELDTSIDSYEPGGTSWLEFDDDSGGDPGVVLR
ncbi:hypothetical protein [Rhodoferax ferrireducens]|uniref:hypothetical protein n=1 Tax=Rhodoferax ferrireducens TaxID=192843 RepID=UPI000E0D1E0C|nr:hypothetical protein [Rhodoferax ferrireducens]